MTNSVTQTPNLHDVTGFIALTNLSLTLLHAHFAHRYRGNRRGNTLSLRLLFAVYATAILIALSALTLLSLYLHQLLTIPSAAGTKNELILVAASFLALTYSGFIGYDRRRRIVASRIASIPCFGDGHHAANNQLLAVEKDPILCFAPQYLTPQSPIHTESSDDPEDLEQSQQHSKRRSSTAGITKRQVWETSCRTSATWVYGRAKRQAWVCALQIPTNSILFQLHTNTIAQPLNVVRTFRTCGKRFVLIKDYSVQDGAGALLLDPAFIQHNHLDKHLIARVIYQAIQRSSFCVLHSWHRKFAGALFERFSQLPAIICMLTGDLRQRVSEKNQRNDIENERCYVSELLWAIITVEVLDYMQHKRRDLPLLTWLIELPTWLCQNDASKIDVVIDEVFETWKAGRNCGRYVSKPCDSECCCHNEFSQTGCGCQCPCVCACP